MEDGTRFDVPVRESFPDRNKSITSIVFNIGDQALKKFKC